MRTLILPFFLILLLSGCTTSEPRRRYVEEEKRKLNTIYQIGMSRDELSTKLNAKPYATATCPEGGWTTSHNPLITRFAKSMERRNSVVIQRCDVYQVPRETSLPSVPLSLGFYFDYVAFDQNDKLIDFYRRFMD